MDTQKKLKADVYRMPYEKFILFSSIIFVTIILLFLAGIYWVLPILIIIYTGILVKIQQIHFLGNAIKVSNNSFPEIYNASIKVANKLSMEIPNVFIVQDPVINAFAIGFMGKKSVVLNSALVESMDSTQLQFILGHEFSHIKCGHTFWLIITNSTKTVKIPLVSNICNLIFLFWSRLAEYTADRGGLISSDDLKNSTLSIVKLCTGEKLSKNVNIDDWINQTQDSSGATKFAEVLLTHPYLVNRVTKLNEYYISKDYKDIYNKDVDKKNAIIVKYLTEITSYAKKYNGNLIDKNKIKGLSNIIQSFGEKHLKLHANQNKDQSVSSNSEDAIIINRIKTIGNQSSIKNKLNIRLMEAVLEERKSLVKELLSSGADSNFQDNSGDSPLHISVTLCNYEISKLLLENGSFLDRSNNKGETPIDIAEKMNLADLALMLKQHCKHSLLT